MLENLPFGDIMATHVSVVSNFNNNLINLSIVVEKFLKRKRQDHLSAISSDHTPWQKIHSFLKHSMDKLSSLGTAHRF